MRFQPRSQDESLEQVSSTLSCTDQWLNVFGRRSFIARLLRGTLKHFGSKPNPSARKKSDLPLTSGLAHWRLPVFYNRLPPPFPTSFYNTTRPLDLRLISISSAGFSGALPPRHQSDTFLLRLIISHLVRGMPHPLWAAWRSVASLYLNLFVITGFIWWKHPVNL